jgi:hypothetical protein
MPAALTASIVDFLRGLALGSLEQDESNRFTLDGLTLGAGKDGAPEIAIRRLEATSLRLASGPIVLEVGRLALHKIVAQVRTEGGRPRLGALEAANAEVSGVKVHGPLTLPGPPREALRASQVMVAAPASGATPAGQAAGGPWFLGPLAAAEGSLRAKIVDAHLMFDADVTVPLHQGEVDFNDATVEHVGPDSRMGVSRLGVYVDAPNGRSYLYQFPSAPVGGVEYERRGALLGPMVSDRGKLQLQAFAEGLLRQLRAGLGFGITEQARQLFDRTALAGEVQAGDGKFSAPGLQAEFVGRAEGRNRVRLHSEAVGRGLTLEMPSLSLRQAVLGARGLELACGDVTGALLLRLVAERAQLRFDFELATMNIAGLRLQLHGPAGA